MLLPFHVIWLFILKKLIHNFTMKLTINQQDVLHWMYNEGGIDNSDCPFHKNTINSLHKKGLITYFTYANCTMWELTDKGLQCLTRLN